MYRSCGDIEYVCRKYHISRISLWRWNKKYETPKNVGEKGQMDVKYVPNECKSESIPADKRFYQYTYIDEATRQRYLYWYEEHTPENTVDFVKT